MTAIRLNSFQTIAIFFIFGNLVGCQTVEPVIPIPLVNEEKDKYITKIEGIVSDSASALTAVVGSIPKGDVRELVQGQVIRLSGVSKPSVAKVEEYTRMINQKDSKAIQKDKDEASKVDEETDALYAMVDARDKEINSLQTKVDLAEAQSKREFKEKVLWLLTCVGMAVSTAGLLVIALTPWKTRGLILIAGGATAVASVWVFSSVWFEYILLSIVVLGCLDLCWVVVRWQMARKNKVQVESQPQ